VGETIVAIRNLLQEDSMNIDNEFPDEELITYLVSIYESITVSLAKASIIWLIGHHHSHHSKALDAVRISLKSFKAQDSFVKKQILLTIAVLYVQINSELEETDSKAVFIRLAYKYSNDMARLDMDYDVRDQSRFIESVLKVSNRAERRILAILTQYCHFQQFKEKKQASLYGIGTMSHFFDQKLLGYKAVPEWAREVTGTEQRKKIVLLY
jgi:AP-3 complex subunit beta